MSQLLSPSSEKPCANRRSLAAFVRDASGVAAVEAGFVLPVMVLVLGFVTILGQALAIAQKVTQTSRTVVDIVSRCQAVSAADLTTILNAAAYTMTPYDSTNLSMVVAQIQTDGTGKATVTWSSAAYNGTALTKGAAFTLPASMAVANATYIYGAASYGYTPMGLGTVLAQPITLSDSAYFSPRSSLSVTYPGTTVCN